MCSKCKQEKNKNILSVFLGYLQCEKNYSSHTVLSYKKDIEQFSEYYKKISKSPNPNIADAEKEDFRLWMIELMEEHHMSSATVNRKISSLKSFYKYLMKVGIIEHSPIFDVITPKKRNRLPVFFTDKELEIITDDDYLNYNEDAEYDLDDFENIRDSLIIDMFYQTGMRRAELINLKDDSIDFSRKTITVFGKRSKERLLPFGYKLEKRIKFYMGVRDKVLDANDGYLFVLKNGHKMYPKAVYNLVSKKLHTVATKQKYSPHTLRHSFATVLLNNGAELNNVKKLLGHSSLASTQVYTHTSFEELQKLYEKKHPRAKK